MALPPSPPQPNLAGSRPNILLVVADDLGYGDLGCYGQLLIHTPNLDRLASQGLRFTHFYAGAPICAPSRAVLFTGLHSGRTAIDRNASPDIPLAPHELTFAQTLAAQRYYTAFIGKWGLGGSTFSTNYGGTYPNLHLPNGGADTIRPEAAHALPTRKGFASSLAVLDHAYAHQHFPEFLWENETVSNIPGNFNRPQHLRTHYAQDIFTSRALSFLTATNLPQPFCLVLAYTLPHRQLVEPPGPNPYRHKPWPPQERTYAAMVSKLDADIGRIAAALDANPSLASNTLLIITSDNGPHDADDHSPFFFNSFGNLRGGKFLLFEGGIRVPCIMRWCGVIPTNTVCSVPCGFVDIHATLAQLAGAPPPPSHGVSLLPLLSGNSLLSRPIPLLWFTPPRSPRDPIAALRSNQWKFILRADGLPKLYNLLHDPSETQNLAPLYPDLVRSFYFTLRQQLRQQIPPLTSPSTSPPK